MHFIPQAQVAGVMPGNRNLHRTLITQQPNVQLDANTETECTLRVPFMSPKLYYDLTTGDGPIGGLYVTVYAPLKYGTGGQSADYTLWCHFEDVELEIPTVPGTFLTQSGFSSSKKSKRANVTDMELKSSGLGPISGPAGVISKATKSISSLGIPILTPLCGVVSWASDIIGGVASAFGFANPRNESPYECTQIQNTDRFTNCDATTSDKMLAYFSTNKLELLDSLGPTTQDEASFGYILSKDSYYNSFDWTTSNVYSDLLYSVDIKQGAFSSTANVTDGVLTWVYGIFTPVDFFMEYFGYWRGSIKITFKFVKTEFHTGRVAIFYYPRPNLGSITVPTLNDSNYLLREIVDLRDGNECSFVIPYTNNSAWIDADDVTGTLAVRVVNPLVAPAASSTTITTLLEVAAGDDFEVAAIEPRATKTLIPCSVSSAAFVTQSGFSMSMGSEGPTSVGNSADAGSLPTETLITSPVNALANTIIPSPSLAPSKYVMGEKLNSVYQVIKRMSATALFGNTAAENTISFRPFETNAVGFTPTGTVLTTSAMVCDPISLFTSFYAYNRGAVKYRTIDRTPTVAQTAASWLVQSVLNIPVLWTVSSVNTDNFYGMDGFNNAIYNGGADVSVPPYGELHCRLTRLNSTPASILYTGPYVPSDEYTNRYSLFTRFSGNVSSLRLYRSAADDYQVGYFLGIPPLYISGTIT